MRETIRKLAMAAVALAVVAGTLGAVGCGGDDEASTPPADTTTAPQLTTETDTTETQSTETQTTDEAPPGPTVIRIAVVGGSPRGGIVRAEVEKDERVVLVVSSDVADEVHLHGYDVSRPVAAGGTARLPFRATLPGRFEVELEERGIPIGEVTVQP